MKVKIKRGDSVKVVAGNDRGKSGEVLAVFPKRNKLIIKGCNVVRKAVKPSDDNKKGGFEAKEMPIDISNVERL